VIRHNNYELNKSHFRQLTDVTAMLWCDVETNYYQER